MRVLVCGGRNYPSYADFCAGMKQAYERAITPSKIAGLVLGGASGADQMAERWARGEGIPVSVYEADWGAHGRAAGPIRNQRMLDEGKPSLVIAFTGGAGTADMVRRAKAAGVPVVHPDEWPVEPSSTKPAKQAAPIPYGSLANT